MASRNRTHPAGRSRTSAALAAFARDTAGRGNWGHRGLAWVTKAVTAAEASWCPTPGAPSIWEEVQHIEHWSRVVLDHLRGRGRPAEQAWPPGAGGERAWRAARRRAARLHGALVREIQRTSGAAWRRRAGPTPYATDQLVLGCIAHIAFHAGQIALLRRLHRHARHSGTAV
ncbi:MAG: DinB family protein [Armatimonadota bacterium]|nr:DinB family protein [Armatimonadota bacterium]MDR7485962.1 DinB family protein [Armatimonadota bacterium]MDR7532160.1 DinB family protein [Armatimonadota bacterium]MDR7537304.1 DinB family protein [Armatimonadota bacterium]